MLTLKELQDNENLLLDFLDFFFQYKPYDYQLRFLIKCLHETRIAGKWCRQSGKSYTVALYILLRAVIEKTDIIVVAPTQNQSDELFGKIVDFINVNPDIKALVKKETSRELVFTNKSRILSLPSGFEGRTIRGYTCDILVIEEAGVMEDKVVNTVLVPMLASKGIRGQIIKIGTPLVRNHFYRSCFEDKRYSVINVVWQDVVKVGQYDQAFIDEQKVELTDIQFRTEYEAEFLDTGLMMFPIELIKNCSLDYPLLPVL